MSGLGRRAFLKVGGLAGGALVLRIAPDAARGAAAAFQPNEWLAIDSNGKATLTAAGSEMGQGIRTSMPMILADELELEWSDVTVVSAQLGPTFKNLSTGGSDSVSSAWLPMRRAAAAAREMLVAAGAQAWSAPVSECRAERGHVVHVPTGRRRRYGSLVAAAARLPLPKEPRLKEPREFRIIGTRVRRVDGATIVTGRAQYGLDVRVPGMKVATLLRCPVLGGRLESFDAAAARAVPGVRDVVQVSNGVAVVADETWPALKGRDALVVRWQPGPDGLFDSQAFRERLKAACGQPGPHSRHDGDAMAALVASDPGRRLEAVYEYAFQAHATLEPMNATAVVRDGRCEVWTPTQALGRTRARVAERLKLRPEDVTVHGSLLGGGFGRRLNVDYAVEAAEIAQAARVPVQLIWTRADDMQHGHYHPASAHRMAGAIGSDGRPVAWLHRKAGSLLSLYPPKPEELTDPAYLRDSMWGAYDIPYRIPNVRIEYVYVPSPVVSGPWRAVYSPPCTFARESFLDELAHLAGIDPLAYRLALLDGEPSVQIGELRIDRSRYREVLRLAAAKAGWGTTLPAGDGRRHGRGIAGNVYAGQTYVAQVAEVSVGAEGDVRVHRVVCAIDPGLPVNPLGIEGQVESGITFGLSACLYGEITWIAGRAQQSSYRYYPVVRLRDAPSIEVHIVRGADTPAGMGEPPVPPTAPAVANAIFAATGRRLRRTPLRLS